MATGPQIVHKQYNSPMGLYSQRNIRETLNKHLHNLDNGTVGIDFNNPNTDKPGNLANSAVLRMLEEEERSRKAGQKKVVWPPTPETNGYHQPAQQQIPAYHNTAQQQLPNYQHQPISAQSKPQYTPQSYQAAPPAPCEGRRQESTGLSRLIPAGPGASPAPPPVPYRQSSQAPLSPGAAKPYRPAQHIRWAPVSAPLSPQSYGSQPAYPSQAQHSPDFSTPSPYSEPVYQPQKHFEPPPSTITLRPQPPVHQKPPPVFSSQPAAASFKGGVNMRGDQKWPPQSVKEAVAAENEARRQLAKGPACRPRKVHKDYTSFFAQHALNHNYPGYRAPPGTQHFEDYSGRSSY